MQLLAAIVTVISGASVGLCFIFLADKNVKEKSKKILLVSGLVMFIVFFRVSSLTLQEGRGKALTELNTSWTYVTEWVQVNDQVVVMKLRRYDSKKSFYYEIQKDKIILWSGEEKDFPAKFRIAFNKKYKVYALYSPK
jgi:hypothetical protein